MHSERNVGVDLVILSCDDKSRVLDPGVVICTRVVKRSNNDVPAFIVETAGLIDIFNYEDIRKFGFVSSVNEILLNGSECSENEMPRS